VHAHVSSAKDCGVFVAGHRRGPALEQRNKRTALDLLTIASREQAQGTSTELIIPATTSVNTAARNTTAELQGFIIQHTDNLISEITCPQLLDANQSPMMVYSLNLAPTEGGEVGVPGSSLGGSWSPVEAESNILNTPTYEPASPEWPKQLSSNSTSMNSTLNDPQASTSGVMSWENTQLFEDVEDVWRNFEQPPSKQIFPKMQNFGDIFNATNFDDANLDDIHLTGMQDFVAFDNSDNEIVDIEHVLKEEPLQTEIVKNMAPVDLPNSSHQPMYEIRIPIPETVISMNEELILNAQREMKTEHLESNEHSNQIKSLDKRCVESCTDQSRLIEQQPTVLQMLKANQGQQVKTRGRGRPPKEGVRTITPKVDRHRLVTDEDSTVSASDGYLTEDELERMKKRRARDLNNEASKRCRENRKLHFKKQLEELDTLTKRNQHLKEILNDLHTQVTSLKESMMDTIFKGRCQNLPPKNEVWYLQFDSAEILAAQAAPCAGTCIDLVPMLQQNNEDMQY